MGKEEQVEEREVLDAIYPDEIKEISEAAFSISIKLDTDENPEMETPTLILHITYPETYPDSGPTLDISAPADQSATHELDLSADKPALLAGLAAVVAENLGMAMVFTLVSALKDAAEALVADRRAARAAAREAVRARAELEENRKFHGDPVTPDSFRAWRDRFHRERAEEERRRAEEREVEEKRKRGGGGAGGAGREEKKLLTGREIWERGLAGKLDDEVEEDEGTDALENLGKLKVIDDD